MRSGMFLEDHRCRRFRSIIFGFIVALAAGAIFFPVAANAYDREAAKTYAENWWNSRNPNYYSFSSGDCTNFVSQALCRGGIAMDQHNDAWAMRYGAGWSWGVYWTGARDFWDYWRQIDGRYLLNTWDYRADTDRGPPTKVKNISGVRRGDIISIAFEDFNGDNWYDTIHHTTIVTGINSHDTVFDDFQGTLICQHTNDYYRRAWNCYGRYTPLEMTNWGFVAWGLSDSVTHGADPPQ